MLLVAMVVLAVLCAVAILAPSGLFTPRLSAGVAGGMMWTEAHGRSGPSLSFLVQNNGWFQATVTGIDDHVTGLGNPSYLFTTSSSAGGPTSASFGGRALLRAHSSLEISLRFGTYDCRRIKSDDDTISIEMTDALGLSSDVSVEPISFHPAPIGEPVPASPDVVGWAGGLTWTACHPGSTPLPANFG